MIGDKTPVGEVRPSQLLWTYGPGRSSTCRTSPS